MKASVRFGATCAVAWMTGLASGQTTYFYDVDGVTPGWGAPHLTSWDATSGAFWSTDAAGTSAGIVWPNLSAPADVMSFGSSTTAFSFASAQAVSISPSAINASGLDVWLQGSGGFQQPLLLNGAQINAGSQTFTIRPQSAGAANSNNQHLRIDNVIAGSGGLLVDSTVGTRNASAEIRLGGNNTYTGLSTLRDSNVVLLHANALGATGSGNGTLVDTAGRLTFGASSATTYASEAVTFNSASNGIRFSNASHTFGGNLTFDRTAGQDIQINVNTAHTGTLAGGITTTSSNNTQTTARINLNPSVDNARLIVNGNVTNGVRADLAAINTGLLIGAGSTSLSRVVELNGINTYTNGTVLRSGTLLVGSNSGLGTGVVTISDGGGPTSNMALLTNAAITVNNTIQVNNATSGSITIGGNSAHVSTYNGQIQSINGNKDYTLAAATGGTVNFNGGIRDFALTANVTIGGTGTVAYTGGAAFDYDGSTTVLSGATLQVNAVLSASTVTVNTGGTLGGAGTITPNTTVNGNLAPGNSPGLLTFTNDLTLGTTANSNFELNGLVRGASYDAVNVGGLLTLDGSITFLGSTRTFADGDSFDLFDWGTLNATGFDVATDLEANLPALDSGLMWDTSSFLTTGVISVTVIPEPGSLLLLGLGLGLILPRRKR